MPRRKELLTGDAVIWPLPARYSQLVVPGRVLGASRGLGVLLSSPSVAWQAVQHCWRNQPQAVQYYE